MTRFLTAMITSLSLPRIGRGLCLLLLVTWITGCASFVDSMTARFAENLSSAILNQNDPETVKQGMPAYLLLIDSLLEGEPDDEKLLFAASKLYGSYASIFVEDPERAGNLSSKAWNLAQKGLCHANKELCQFHDQPYEKFSATLQQTSKSDTEALYGYATAWLVWIQAHSSNLSATADLPKVTLMMARVANLDNSHDNGVVHLYLGVLSTLLPPALGGKPEQGRAHFEQAMALSGERNLMAKVLFAKHYARMVFDKELHDRILREAVEANPEQPGFTLMNVLAQKEAVKLLESGKDYF